MKKRKILATGGILTTLVLGAGNQMALAQSMPTQGASMQTGPANTAQAEYKTAYRSEMAEFGLDQDEFLADEDLDDLSRQSLAEEGFSPSQIHKMISKANSLKTNQKGNQYQDEE